VFVVGGVGGVGFWGRNEHEVEGGKDDGDAGGWNRGDGDGVVVVGMEMVVMKKNKRGDGEDGKFVVVVVVILLKMVKLSSE